MADNRVSPRVYEDFDPTTRWMQEPGADTLVVSLPGFKREQLKVQATKTGIRVLGERPVGGNKWLRFRKGLSIPENVRVDLISAKFEGENLYVKHPKIEQEEKPETKPATDETQQKTTDQPQEQKSDDQKPAPKSDSGRVSETSKDAEPVTEAKKRKNGVKFARQAEGVQDRLTASKKYKQLFSNLSTEVKSKRKLAAGLAAAAALVLMLGLYAATKALRSYTERKI